MKRFRDRREAGRELAALLSDYARDHPVVLGLPRGGVPVGFEVARALNAEFDVCVVRKLGVPGHEELAMGAIGSGGVRYLNEDVLASLRIDGAALEEVTEREQRELRRRESLYRGDAPPPALQGRTVILTDDGLATGATMQAAVRALKMVHPAKIAVATPVASQQAIEALRQEVEDVVSVMVPPLFQAIGIWYDDFSQTSDAEVRALLREAARQHGTGSRNL